jgi:eukaryotic-like serine/threonine-protein kinase
VAREVAIRDGIEAVLTGDIAHAGTGFVISARLVSSQTGEPLVALRETAEDSTRILRAIDRLSHGLRRRIGESLRTIDDNEALEEVTTPSLEALRKYSQSQAANAEGDTERSIGLLKDAISLDTGFAMAYRRLGVLIGNSGGRRSEQVDALSRAYAHRDRLTDRERYLTLGTYHMQVSGDRERAAASYRSLLDEHPNDVVALNNLSIILSETGNFAQAEGLARRAITVQPAMPAFWSNLLNAQVLQGKLDSAEATLAAMRGASRSPVFTAELEIGLAVQRGDYDSATAMVRQLADARRESADLQRLTTAQLAGLAVVQGRLSEAGSQLGRVVAMNESAGRPETALFFEMVGAGIELWFRGNSGRAVQQAEAALRRRPLSSFDPRDRPYLGVAMLFAEAGRPERARALLSEFDRQVPEGDRRLATEGRHAVLGAIALAERRPQDAITEFRLQDQASMVGAAANLGRAYDLAGMPDSAIASYQRFLDTPFLGRLPLDAMWRARALYRLGELYEGKGDRVKAADRYAEFIKLWKRADPDLQPQVTEAKQRLEALSGERPTT